jgi:uncharacterized protein YkwD
MVIAIIVGVLLLVGAVVGVLNSGRVFGWPPSDAGPALVLPVPTSHPADVSPTPTDLLLSTTATADPGAPPTGTQPLEDQVVAATNAERAKVKCAALTVDDRLRTAAQVHSADMASYAYLSHTGHDGSDPVRRMLAAGYPIDKTVGWAENVARGYPTVDAVMTAFMSSAGHRANIVNCTMKVIGVGVARSVAGELYWTQDFGTR